MKVAFRTDASLAIGTGHVARCIALASELRANGAETAFVCRQLPGHQIDVIRRAGLDVRVLPPGDATDAGNGTPHAAWLPAPWRTDATQTRAALGDGWDWLVVDHYALDAAWHQTLRVTTRRILAIDDVADRPLDCDVLLDQNMLSGDVSRYRPRVAASCRQLLGPRYALLRAEFAAAAPLARPREALGRLLVFFGGVDAGNETARVLSVLANPTWNALALDVVAGPANPHAVQLAAQCGAMARARLHRDPPDLVELMRAADLALGAAGVTTWERASVGLPALIITVGDNQVPIAQAAQEAGIAQYLGRSGTLESASIGRMLSVLRDEPQRLKAMSLAASDLVDARGAERVAQTMIDA